MTTPTTNPPTRLSAEELADIRRRHNQQPPSTATADDWRQVDQLLTDREVLERELRRAQTPSIVEALKLLDDAGYGKEVPNSLSDMIKKVLAELQEAREQVKEFDEALQACIEAQIKSLH